MSAVAGEVPLDSARGRKVLATTVFGAAVVQLTGSVVNLALPSLAADLGASSAQQQWVVNGYLLMVASLILVGGAFGDRFGRVRVYQVGIILFTAASLLCAAAPSAELLIGARLVQGVGGALLVPGSLAIIEATLAPADRGLGVGRWSGLSGIAGAVGPLIGGLAVELSWRWVFLISVPTAVAAFVLSAQVPESVDGEAAEHNIDVVGAALVALTLGSLSYGFIQGQYWWAGVAMVAGAALLWWERRQDAPMVPIDLFSIRPFLAANLVTLFVYGGMGVAFFLVSVYLQVSLGWSPLAAGATMLPITVLMLLLSSRAGALAQRIGPRLPLTVGPLVLAAGIFLLSGIEPGDQYLTGVLPGVLVFGCGLALSVAPVTATALGSVPDARAGAASGLNNAVAQTGQLLAIAAIPPLAGLSGDALSNPEALTDGFSTALLLAAAAVAVGGLSAFWLLADSQPAKGEPTSRFHCGVNGPEPSGHTTISSTAAT